MAAIDIPWAGSMSKPTYNSSNTPSSPLNYDPNPATVAAFAPTSSSGYSATAKQRSTVIVHKKSPLLVATPPQITRTLAHSHPFILPLNKLVGLVSWSTDDAWESFLLVTAFWAVCLYGDVIIQYATPVNGVIFLILGMYSRRYSPLSSSTKQSDKRDGKAHKRSPSKTPQHKSLDEIVETMTQFTSRCNILLDPFLIMTDFLSTQTSATSATTRPALTTLLIRIILITPLWILLTLPPLHILTPRRVLIAIGTVILTWHSQPAKVSRVILWRSILVRRVSAFVTGLDFDTHPDSTLLIRKSPAHQHANEVASTKKRRPDSSGVRFTFVLYENQRRWIGLGWTTSMFAYERAAWTDEHLNPAPSRENFELPEVDGRLSRWRWVEGSKWRIENGGSDQKKGKSTSLKPKSKLSDGDSVTGDDGDGGGWIYYDNKWNDGRYEDGWGRYTRRRKWFRDAELVEITPSTEITPAATPNYLSDAETGDEKDKSKKAIDPSKMLSPVLERDNANLGDSVATLVPDKTHTPAKPKATGKDDDAASTKSSTKRRSGWFTRSRSNNRSTDSTSESTDKERRKRDRSTSKSSKSMAFSENSTRSRDGVEEDVLDRWRDGNGKGLGVGEDVYMGLN